MKNTTKIHSDAAPAAIGPYSQALAFGDLLFCSGQIALNAAGQMVGDNAREQAVQVLENLGAVLKAGGASFQSVLKVTVFLSDFEDYAVVNEVYSEYFDDAKPARAALEVSRLPKDALLEIECIAARTASS